MAKKENLLRPKELKDYADMSIKFSPNTSVYSVIEEKVPDLDVRETIVTMKLRKEKKTSFCEIVKNSAAPRNELYSGFKKTIKMLEEEFGSSNLN